MVLYRIIVWHTDHRNCFGPFEPDNRWMEVCIWPGMNRGTAAAIVLKTSRIGYWIVLLVMSLIGTGCAISHPQSQAQQSEGTVRGSTASVGAVPTPATTPPVAVSPTADGQFKLFILTTGSTSFDSIDEKSPAVTTSQRSPEVAAKKISKKHRHIGRLHTRKSTESPKSPKVIGDQSQPGPSAAGGYYSSRDKDALIKALSKPLTDPLATTGRGVGHSPAQPPLFPWPPPAASASYVLPNNLLAKRNTIGDVIDTILTALERRGYVERSFFGTPGNGVALVTRLERIKDNGASVDENDRWPVDDLDLSSSSSVLKFLTGLFYVDKGRYRVIVFILGAPPFSQSPERISSEEALNWLQSGDDKLPPEVRERPFNDSTCDVLVYEFASDGTSVKMVRSHLTGREHLEKAGVLTLLETTK